MLKCDLAIIGGGAAGLAAACAAGQAASVCNSGAGIVLLEKNDRVGRKLLTTGNGRCNLTNTDISDKHYHSRCPDKVKEVLLARPLAETLAFFTRLGLRTIVEDGRVYPGSQTASSVLDVLRLETERLSVSTLTGFNAETLVYDAEAGGFIVQGATNGVFSRKLIIATGGMAAPHTGSDGIGYTWLSSFGHIMEPAYPALTPLLAEHPALKVLKGLRIKPCRLTLVTNDGRVLAVDTGELLFTEFGLSGIAAMQVSGAAGGYGGRVYGIKVYADLLPELPEEELPTVLRTRREELAYLPAEHFFTGWFHKQIGRALLQMAGLDIHNLNTHRHTVGDMLTDGHLNALASILKSWAFMVTGTRGFAAAQITGGGARLDEFDTGTLSSLKMPGLFAAGELLDVYGDCGGYNLHWAWTTGCLAGRAAVMCLPAAG
jgi:predicted Rossmann fold flavoprotein